jgi:hypothetical protein
LARVSARCPLRKELGADAPREQARLAPRKDSALGEHGADRWRIVTDLRRIGERESRSLKTIRENPMKNGRGGEIRTHDLLYPKQARYQATLRPDS